MMLAWEEKGKNNEMLINGAYKHGTGKELMDYTEEVRLGLELCDVLH